MNKSRKRMRCDDDDDSVQPSIQFKHFVNQKLVEKCDPNMMKEVYTKTLNMIFAGARNQIHKSPVQTLDTNNSPVTSSFNNINDKLLELQGCKLCWRDTKNSSFVCKNCCLKICSRCNLYCCGCNASLCTNCVKIFGCAIDETPICEGCKFYAL